MRFPVLLLGISSVCLGVLFIYTNPERLPAVVFIILFAALYGFVFSIVTLLGQMLRNVDVISWEVPRIRRTAAIVTCFPIFLLVLQSIGQLTVRDVLITSSLFVLLYAYFGAFLRRSRK